MQTAKKLWKLHSQLHRECNIGENANSSLVVVGDQKTYNRLQELKGIYSEDLNWVVPFIGDWHLLHNFHPVLMQVYYEAGLKDLARASGFRGETLNSLQRCSNFQRVHYFLIQAWEGFYRHMLLTYISSLDHESLGDLLSATSAQLCVCNDSCISQQSTSPLPDYIKQIHKDNPNLLKGFNEWLLTMAENDPNWKFWINFVYRDMFAYISLFLSVRGGIWKLRLYAIKQIAPLFAAFDRPHYQKLLPSHLHEVLTMPQEVIDSFENGGFVCSVSGIQA